MSVPRPPHETWDSMLPGPPSRNNGGSADCSTSGLLAYGAGSSVAVVDSRSMQLVSVLPMPVPSTSSIALAPFVTSLRWTPQPLRRDLLTHEISNSHLLLAVGDRQGRIAIWDFRLKLVLLWMEFDPSPSFTSSDKSKLGIQDLCWIRARADSWILASINGPSLLALWNTSTGRCIWKYDASPEFFSCIRRDPFDSRHFCVVGLKGFLLSVKVLGDNENDVVIKEIQIPTVSDSNELQKLERDAATGSSSPALAVFPLYVVKFSFSPQWRHVLFVIFPKELVVFDLQYETSLSSGGVPRGCGKFLDVLPDPDNDLLYCAHLDGKLSTWRRKDESSIEVRGGERDASSPSYDAPDVPTFVISSGAEEDRAFIYRIRGKFGIPGSVRIDSTKNFDAWSTPGLTCSGADAPDLARPTSSQTFLTHSLQASHSPQRGRTRPAGALVEERKLRISLLEGDKSVAPTYQSDRIEAPSTSSAPSSTIA
ncbi:hypothetical protein HHK36_006263 [Tetracentron sinense]|uniref:WDR11 first beta-propeller domain-containing protein n=1 Tax=Tetracentron sinense TaxID=13715 RepID=A0A834ZL81_TETSI|nr:hypothetical protein HHK36_006263 [Tetracentron sinense]